MITAQLSAPSPFDQELHEAIGHSEITAVRVDKRGRGKKGGRLTFVIKGGRKRYIVIAGPGAIRIAQFRDDLNPHYDDDQLSEIGQKITLRDRTMAIKIVELIDVDDHPRRSATRIELFAVSSANVIMNQIRNRMAPAVFETRTGIAPDSLEDLILKILRLAQCSPALRQDNEIFRATVTIAENWHRVHPVILAIDHIIDWHGVKGHQPFFMSKRCGQRLPLMIDIREDGKPSGHDFMEAATIAAAALDAFYREASAEEEFALKRDAALRQLGLEGFL